MPVITPKRIGAVLGVLGVAAGGTTVAVRELETAKHAVRLADVPRQHAAPNAAQHALVRMALRYGPRSGIHYVWGGSTTRGFDCSGFTSYVYAHAIGVPIPRTSQAQFQASSGARVPFGLERAGDALYFVSYGTRSAPGHTALYLGNGRYVEYYSSGRPARFATLSEQRGYVGAHRWYLPARVPSRILVWADGVAARFHRRIIRSFTQKGWARWAIDYVPRSKAMYLWAKHQGLKARLMDDRTRILHRP